jgi:hypothetical protein
MSESAKTVYHWLRALSAEHDIGAIPIGENDRLIGMVTDRDIVCKGLAQDSFDARRATARKRRRKGFGLAFLVCQRKTPPRLTRRGSDPCKLVASPLGVLGHQDWAWGPRAKRLRRCAFRGTGSRFFAAQRKCRAGGSRPSKVNGITFQREGPQTNRRILHEPDRPPSKSQVWPGSMRPSARRRSKTASAHHNRPPNFKREAGVFTLSTLLYPHPAVPTSEAASGRMTSCRRWTVACRAARHDGCNLAAPGTCAAGRAHTAHWFAARLRGRRS